jgi:cytochrome P450
MLLFAGHETTRNLIGNGVYTLLTHPEALADLRAEPELSRGAVEEVLRYESPVQAVGRVVKADLEIEGVRLPVGSSVIFMNAAAQRDPEQFEDPDRFDIRRRRNRHLAFGGDHHVCLGSTLARLEGQIALEALVKRFPGLQLTEERPEWVPNVAFRGLRSLRVRL